MADTDREEKAREKAEFDEELAYAEKVTEILLSEMREENDTLSKRREQVLEDRRYFSDHFAELSDERLEWLQSEHRNLKAYDISKVALTKYARQLNEPYFARVDFLEDGKKSVRRIYIGVGNIMHDYKLYVYDWRAPVASLYYECEIGRGGYTAPGGRIDGEVTEKRKFTFEGGRLVSVSSINMPSDDEFLSGILKKHATGKMRTIIESLQKEQNRIVRDFIDGAYVIQGCAGSGKSSVALHKIAYIMYSFRERLQNSDIVILSPNNMFASYIANVLPDLGEENVTQMTQEELIGRITGDCGFSYAGRGMSSERVLALMEEKSIAAMHFKNSALFKTLLDRYCDYFARTAFRPKALFLDEAGDRFVSEDDLRFLYEEEFGDDPVFLRPKQMVRYIAKRNRIRANDVLEELENQLYDMFTTCDMARIYADVFHDRAFFATLPEEMQAQLGDPAEYVILPHTWEDGCAVAYLRVMLGGIAQEENVFYFFADEAQDLSPVMLGVIKAAYGSANLLFSGDIRQNVFCCEEDFSDSVKRTFSGKHFKKYSLDVNYRSTREISEFACRESGLPLENSCIRRGEEPSVFPAEGRAAEKISAWLSEMNARGHKSAAVICASRKEADDLELEVCLPERTGMEIRFLPVYVAKGLEYDCVLVVNTDETMREKDRILGTNMFYTSCTRALHDLAVLV